MYIFVAGKFKRGTSYTGGSVSWHSPNPHWQKPSVIKHIKWGFPARHGATPIVIIHFCLGFSMIVLPSSYWGNPMTSWKANPVRTEQRNWMTSQWRHEVIQTYPLQKDPTVSPSQNHEKIVHRFPGITRKPRKSSAHVHPGFHPLYCPQKFHPKYAYDMLMGYGPPPFTLLFAMLKPTHFSENNVEQPRLTEIFSVSLRPAGSEKKMLDDQNRTTHGDIMWNPRLLLMLMLVMSTLD